MLVMVVVMVVISVNVNCDEDENGGSGHDTKQCFRQEFIIITSIKCAK